MQLPYPLSNKWKCISTTIIKRISNKKTSRLPIPLIRKRRRRHKIASKRPRINQTISQLLRSRRLRNLQSNKIKLLLNQLLRRKTSLLRRRNRSHKRSQLKNQWLNLRLSLNRNQLRSQLRNQLRSQLKSQLRSQLRNQLRSKPLMRNQSQSQSQRPSQSKRMRPPRPSQWSNLQPMRCR